MRQSRLQKKEKHLGHLGYWTPCLRHVLHMTRLEQNLEFCSKFFNIGFISALAGVGVESTKDSDEPEVRLMEGMEREGELGTDEVGEVIALVVAEHVVRSGRGKRSSLAEQMVGFEGLGGRVPVCISKDGDAGAVGENAPYASCLWAVAGAKDSTGRVL